MLLLFSQLVWAEPFITEMGSPVEIRSAGAWIRVFPTEESWVAAMGSNQTFYVGTLQKTGERLTDWELVEKRQIVEISGLIDHGIKRCPDGSYLHAASGMPPEGDQGGDPTDYLHLWRYDENFEILQYAEFRDGIGTHAHNDPNVICSPNTTGLLLSIQGYQFATDLFVLNQDLALDRVIPLEDYPRGNGGSVLYDVHDDQYIQLGMAHDKPLTINRYDADWNLIDTVDREVVDAPLRAYWPQGLIKVGDYYIVAYMGKDDAWQGSDKGDVFLGVFDQSWSLVEQQRVTAYEDGEAAMRPWVARKGDQLLVSFDLYNEQQIVEAKLNLSAFGLDGSEPDTGVDPQGDWNAPVSTDESTKDSQCGCQSDEATLWFPFLLLLSMRRPRKN